MTHEEMIRLEEIGKLLIGVDRTLARKFYTDVSCSEIARETGESPYCEKTVVMGSLVLGPIALVASIAIGFIVFHWYGIATFLTCPLVYLWFASASTMGLGRMYGITFLLVTAVGLQVLWFRETMGPMTFFTVFIFALWCARLVYARQPSFFAPW